MVDDLSQGGEEMLHKTPKPQSALSAREEEVLDFWSREKIFEQSLAKDAPKGEYVFYDGPPFANGLPHYGHILASTIKDAIPRYRTMRGWRVRRRWGWDCHGLPVENLVERELRLKSKRDIEKYGVEKFNEAARVSIMKDVKDWKRIIPRLGRWAEMESDYKTMDPSYTESVWWAFKNLYDKGLIYEGFKSLHYCPHCGTTLSNFEVAQGYKDIDDIAVTVKLTLVDEPDTSLLIWTTTPWTLPGNTAAAVNPALMYEKVKVGDGYIIVAEGKVEGGVVKKISGKELVGKKYLPPFDYYANELHKHKSHAWRVYAADYVTMDEGTGVVHLAPAYGADDLALAQKNKIPLIQHVTDEGKFVATVKDFAGLFVKPKGNPRETDEMVAALLAQRGLLFKKEKVTHSYPHCWRCDTPLLNWVANSWFVKVSALKRTLLKENAKVAWVPEHVGAGRFNNGLESAPDWAISRSRFWGAPLPVWRHSKTREVRVAGSVNDMLSMVRRSGNRYFVMRHGEAVNNVEGIVDSSGNSRFRLTQKGRTDAAHTADELRKEKIDFIITSPIPRTHETADVVQRELGLPDSALMVDGRLRDIGFGELDGKTLEAWKTFFASPQERYTKAPAGGETFRQLRQRVGEFLFEAEQRYSNKNILFVTHGAPGFVLHTIAARESLKEVMPKRSSVDERYLQKAQVREMPFTPFPHNADYELDLHRPYIDDVAMGSSVHGEWRRVPDVFDCWFESGSMPFASNHYPFGKGAFDPKRLFGFAARGYPADFIAEGLDQTRGWFYSLIVLGVALFGRSPYKHVIVNGTIVTASGEKMSKRLKNYPDPMEIVERYGADALRYYLLASSVMRAEDLRFSERGVDEVVKKILMRLDNVRSFYELYAEADNPQAKGKAWPSGLEHPESVGYPSGRHILDRWILARLAELVRRATDGYEGYELDEAVRPLGEFIDDLSTWYVRRSRERFSARGRSASGGKDDVAQASSTLRRVLQMTARVMAPCMPFFAEDLWRRVRKEKDPISVHLASWPEAGELAPDPALLSSMRVVRAAASAGLEARERAGLKIRQPLASLTTTQELVPELAAILMDEVNVKEIRVGKEVVLDTHITPELREQGVLRELIRRVQEWRKEQGLKITDRPGYTMELDLEEAAVAKKYKMQLLEATGLNSLRIDVSKDSD